MRARSLLPSSVAAACIVGMLVVEGCGGRVSQDPLPIADAGEADTGNACAAPFVTCGDRCTDVRNDARACGACGTICGDGEVCVAGACAKHCPSTMTFCDGRCRELRFDPANCGACGLSCAAGEVCNEGECGLICGGGSTRCGDRCVATDHDVDHCGTCDVQCPGGADCVAGSCACPSSRSTTCDGSCVDVQTDPKHCGACGNVCATGACIEGACVRAIRVATGDRHACAVTEDDGLSKVRCWGDPEQGATGPKPLGAKPGPPIVVSTSKGRPMTLVAGGETSCAGDVGARCWGMALGVPDKYPGFGPPSEHGKIAVGGAHVCGTDSALSLTCVGANHHGQLGNPAGMPHPGGTVEWTTVNVWSVIGVAAGGDRTCIWRTDGKAICWGAPWVGDGTAGDHPLPTTVQFDGKVIEVAVGDHHSCLRDDTGETWCWGDNDLGQLGVDPKAASFLPMPIGWYALGKTDALALGDSFSCALRAGQVFCWGDGAEGRLGDGTETARFEQKPVVGLSSVVQLAASAAGACAVTSDGNVWCWGSNAGGRLGAGFTGAYSTKPVRIVW